MKSRGTSASTLGGLAYLFLFLSLPVFFLMNINPSGEHHLFSSNTFFICISLPTVSLAFAVACLFLVSCPPGPEISVTPARSLSEGRKKRHEILRARVSPISSPWLFLIFLLPVFVICFFELGYAFDGIGTTIPLYRSMKSFMGVDGPPAAFMMRMGLVAAGALLWPVVCLISLVARNLWRSASSRS